MRKAPAELRRAEGSLRQAREIFKEIIMSAEKKTAGHFILGRTAAIGAAALALGVAACTKGEAETASAGADETAQQASDNRDKQADSDKETSAPADQAATTQSVEPAVSEEASEELAKKREALLTDAVEALKETRKAVEALDEGDKDAALEALALVTGKLEIIIARKPELALAPVDVAAVREDLIATVDGVKRIRRQIEDLVDDGDLQAAKPLMDAFGSEIVIATTSIPLATYPDAIKDVAALIDDDKIEEAKTALDAALSTLVVTKTVIPLPLVRAQAMLDAVEKRLEDRAGEQPWTPTGRQAEQSTSESSDTSGGRTETGAGETSEEKSASTEDEASVESLLENAAYQIELAKAFGYGDDTLYKKLQDDLKKLDKRIENKQDAGNLFATLQKQISGLMSGDNE